MNLQNKKFSKINFEETDLNQPKTPPKGDEDSFSQMKTKWTNNSNVMYSNNFEYSIYGNSNSNSSQKERNYKSDGIQSRSFNQSNGNDCKQSLYINRRENLNEKQKLNISNTIVNSQLTKPNAIQFRNLNQLNYVPIIFNSAEQKSLERINKNNGVNNISNAYKKYPKWFKLDNKKIPYILQKRNSNSPFILKGQNFNSEEILPPYLKLEDVFLKNELKQKNNLPNSILIKNGENSSNEGMDRVSSYVRYFHTSDGARNKANINNSSSLDPYQDSPQYIQHSGSSDFLGTWKPFKPKVDRSTINSETGPRIHEEEDSPFFIKRRIRSSNPHSRIKRKPHPMISKQFFKKQMSRDGVRNKPGTTRDDDMGMIQNSSSKSETRQTIEKNYGEYNNAVIFRRNIF